MGKMHRISEESELSFKHSTTWSLFGGNQTDELGDYDENELFFQDLIKSLDDGTYDVNMINQLKKSYYQIRGKAFSLWNSLPHGPIQGDFCPNNMVIDANEKIVGVFDWNISGDEVFINEACAVAIYTIFHFEWKEEVSEENKLRAFFDAYREHRHLTKKELEIAPVLFNIIRPFRFDRIEPILERITKNEREQVEEDVQETVRLMQISYPSI